MSELAIGKVLQENPDAVKRRTYVEVRKAQLQKEQEQDVEALRNWETKTLVDCTDANFKETYDLLEEPSDDDEDKCTKVTARPVNF